MINPQSFAYCKCSQCPHPINCSNHSNCHYPRFLKCYPSNVFHHYTDSIQSMQCYILVLHLSILLLPLQSCFLFIYLVPLHPFLFVRIVLFYNHPDSVQLVNNCSLLPHLSPSLLILQYY